MRSLRQSARGSGQLAPVLLFPGVGRPSGGRHVRRAASDGRGQRADIRRTAATCRPAGLDSDTHNTDNAAHAGCPAAVGEGDARGGASMARLPLPWLEDMGSAGGVEGPEGSARGGRQGRSRAVAARAGACLAAALPDGRPWRDGSRSGSRTVTRPNRRGGSSICNARWGRAEPRGVSSSERGARRHVPGADRASRQCRSAEGRRATRQPCGWRFRRRRGAG